MGLPPPNHPGLVRDGSEGRGARRGQAELPSAWACPWSSASSTPRASWATRCARGCGTRPLPRRRAAARGEIAFTAAYLDIPPPTWCPQDRPISDGRRGGPRGRPDRGGRQERDSSGSLRNIKRATPMKNAGPQRLSSILFGKDKLERSLGLRPRLHLPTSKACPARTPHGRFTAVQEAIGTAKRNRRSRPTSPLSWRTSRPRASVGEAITRQQSPRA